MLTEAKSPTPWDLADKKSLKVSFTADSFYIVVDGLSSDAVHSACRTLKTYATSWPSVRCRGPKALKTERRRWMRMREMRQQDATKGVYVTKVRRFRNILLVINPSYELMSGLVTIQLPSDVNLKIEPYDNQYDLREDR